MVIPSVRPFTQASSSQMGVRSASPSTLYVNQRWSSNSAATLPESAAGEVEGRVAPIPISVTPFSSVANAWTAALEIPKSTNPCAGSWPMGYPLPPWLTQQLSPPQGRGGVEDIPPTPFLSELGVEDWVGMGWGGGGGWEGGVAPYLDPQYPSL